MEVNLRGIKKFNLKYCPIYKKKWNIDQVNLFSPMNLDPTTFFQFFSKKFCLFD